MIRTSGFALLIIGGLIAAFATSGLAMFIGGVLVGLGAACLLLTTPAA
jgi:hypothetical protein